jgi:hypothetical protein
MDGLCLAYFHSELMIFVVHACNFLSRWSRTYRFLLYSRILLKTDQLEQLVVSFIGTASHLSVFQDLVGSEAG